GVPGVIELRQPVQLAAARAEVQCERAPATSHGTAHEAHRVVRPRRALEAVEDEKERRPGRPWAVHPVEVDEVTVARGDPTPPRPDAVAAKERAPDGLEMPVSAPPGWPERRADYSWPSIRA